MSSRSGPPRNRGGLRVASSEKPGWLLEGARKDRQTVDSDWSAVGQVAIHGVKQIEMRAVVTGYGHLIEMLRGEWLGENAAVDQVYAMLIQPGAINAWHSHAEATDRLFAAAGNVRVMLYDSREDSPTCGVLNQYRLSGVRPSLLIIPPKVWHGVEVMGLQPVTLLNAVDRAYSYESPDHWRLPPDTPHIPYAFV